MPHALSAYASGPQKPAATSPITIDWSLGDMVEPAALTGATTFVFQNASAGQICTLKLVNSATATARALTWPTSVLGAAMYGATPTGGATPTSLPGTTTQAALVMSWRFDGINYLYMG